MYVALNMAMSIDGKIAPAHRGPVKLGSDFDSRRMAEIRAESDAVINGAVTFRAYPFALRVYGKDLLKKRLRKGLELQPISAISSSDLKIPMNTKWQKAQEIRRWVFCGRNASATKIRVLEKSGVQVWRLSKKRPGPEEIIRIFSSHGVKNLLLEGGGEFNAAFFERGLVDRIYITLVPILIGGRDAPTIFAGKGLKEFSRYQLKESRKVGQELYLIYDKIN